MKSTGEAAISNARQLLVGAAMAGPAVMVGRAAFSRYFGVNTMMLAVAAVLMVAGYGLTRRSLVAAVLSRGVVWLAFAPTAAALSMKLASGRPSLDEAVLAIGTGVALLAARPVLHTPEARREFAPLAFRSWLLGGSIATASAGITAAFLAAFTVHGPATFGFAALAAALFASSIAVVRMRAWGILLGALTSLTLLVLGALSDSNFLAYATAAAPALFLHVAPIVIARLKGGVAPSSTTSAPEHVDDVHYHVRVAVDELDAASPDDTDVEELRATSLRA